MYIVHTSKLSDDLLSWSSSLLLDSSLSFSLLMQLNILSSWVFCSNKNAGWFTAKVYNTISSSKAFLSLKNAFGHLNIRSRPLSSVNALKISSEHLVLFVFNTDRYLITAALTALSQIHLQATSLTLAGLLASSSNFFNMWTSLLDRLSKQVPRYLNSIGRQWLWSLHIIQSRS